MRYFLISIFNLIGLVIFAQPEPCGPNPAMTSTCASACVICDIDGFSGVNDLSIIGQNVPGFCTTFQHNIQFIAFIAGTENITIQVEVGDCVGGGQSLELGFFESLDCQTFTPITDCDTDIDQFTSQTFTNYNPLVVGQHYYMIIDGSGSANCEWTFNVLDGSTEVLPLTTSGDIEHVDEVCPEVSTTFFTTGDVGAALFFWTINGVSQSELSQSVDFSFPSDGEYEICVTAANACDQAPPSCTTINVRSVEDSFVDERLCEGECVFVNGIEYCSEGNFIEVVTLENGCDSTIFISLVKVPTSFTNYDVWICNDQSFTVGESSYTETGSYIDTVLTADECDSLIFTELLAIECEIIGTSEEIPVICNGTSSGTLIFSVDQGTPPLSFTYTNIADPSITGTGTTNLLIDNQIPDLPVGTYQIYIEDNFGNDVVVLQEITEPPLLSAELIPSDYGGFNVSCSDSNIQGQADGTIDVIASGGVPPYMYNWSDGQTGAQSTQLSAQNYTVSILDAVGCEVVYDFQMSSPPALEPNIDFIDPSCDGFNSGEILVTDVLGGVMPYQYSLDGINFSSDSLFAELLEGTYEVFVQDANACIVSETGSITAPQIPVISFSEDLSIFLADSATIIPLLNDIDILSLMWTPSEYLSCNDCLEPTTTAVNDITYTLSVTSVDDCTDEASIDVIIDKRRRIYIPNIFSPNGDSVNDFFYLFAGPEAMTIDMNIFDRWGGLVYKSGLANLNDPAAGWDGRINGQRAAKGVYSWTASIAFIDGIEIFYSGTVTLI